MCREGRTRRHRATPWLRGDRWPCNPLSSQVVFPEGVPVEADVAPLNLEGVQVPVSAEKDGYESIVVDIYKKKAE